MPEMNRKGGIGDLLLDNAIYLVLAILFFSGIFWFVFSYGNGAAIWEDYYAKEIVKIIDFSSPWDNVLLEVQRATEIAKDNNVASFSEIFSIDNIKNEVCVKLSLGRKTCYNYFNNVDIVGIDLRLAEGRNKKGKSVNLLYFKIIDKGEQHE